MNDSSPASPVSNSKAAVWSLVLGILAILLSVVCIGPLLAIPAVICGHKAFSSIKLSGGALGGKGFALGGLITGYLSLAMIPVIAMMAAIAVPNFAKARDTAMRNACINNLRMLDGAKQQWALENKKVETDAPTLAELQQYLPARHIICPAGGSYTINVVKESPACSVPGHQLPGR